MTRLATAAAAAAAAAALAWLALKLREEEEEEPPAGTRKFPTHPSIKLPLVGQLLNTFKLSTDNQTYGLSRFGFLGGIDGCSACDFGFIKFAMVYSHEAMKQIYTNHPFQNGGIFEAVGFTKVYDNLPGIEETKYLFGNGLFIASDNDRWWPIAHRILLKPFSRQGMMQMVPLMNEQADLLVGKLRKDLGSGVGPLRIYDYTVMMAVETLGTCLMGMSFESFSGEPVPFLQHLKNWLDINADMGNIPPQLWWLFPKTMKSAHDSADFLKAYTKDLLARRRRGETQALSKCPDLLDCMLETADTLSGEKLPDEVIGHELMSFLFAGQDSTAVALSSFFCFVAANPAAQAKLVAEIQEVLGDEPEVKWAHLNKLKYLDWAIKETLRLVPPVPGVFKRNEVVEALSAGKGKTPFHLPKKTNLLLAFLPLHLDPAQWGDDAHEWKPERWAEGAPHPFAYAPFSHGPRACIGKEFTLTEQKICAVKLLQHFIIQKAAGDWAKQPGATKLKESEWPHYPACSPHYGVDVEYNPKQAFTGINMPLELHPRPQLHKPEAAKKAEAAAQPAVVFSLDESSQGHATPLSILYGSDGGSTTELAERVMETAQELGFAPTVKPLNEAIGDPALGTDGLLLVLSATYNGCPPANAGDFVNFCGAAIERHERPVDARFAVLGCGHSDWADTFQAIPTLLDESLEKIGGHRLLDLHTADSKKAPEEDFVAWTAKLWPALAAAAGIKLSCAGSAARRPPLAIPEVSVVPAEEEGHLSETPLVLPFQRDGEWVLAKVAEKSELTPNDPDGTSTVCLALEAAVHPSGDAPLRYAAGDHLMVMAENAPALVATLLKRMGLDSSTLVTFSRGFSANGANGGGGDGDASHPKLGRSLSGRLSGASAGAPSPLTGKPRAVSLEALLLRSVDLVRPCSAAALHLLADRATDEDDRTQLSMVDLVATKATVLELLMSAKSVTLSVAELLACLPQMKPRYYSISSSPNAKGGSAGRATITVGVVDAISPTGRKHRGVASNYLKKRSVGDLVWVRTKSVGLSFRPPPPNSPAIMICAGTGLAPFVGFLEDMAAGAAGGSGTSHLFFGCRRPERHLHRERLEGYVSDGTLAALHVAYSRTGERIYVQELIKREAKTLWPLLQGKARVYVCGDAARMAPDVKRALKAVCSSAGGLTEQKASAYIDQLCAVGPNQRYFEDVWASGA